MSKERRPCRRCQHWSRIHGCRLLREGVVKVEKVLGSCRYFRVREDPDEFEIEDLVEREGEYRDYTAGWIYPD